MTFPDRRIISIHNDEELDEAELILKKTIRTPVRKLTRATFHEHEKQGDPDEIDERITNQSVGGVQRARELAETNPQDTLPAVYGGLFTVAEYFTRSFDAIKGKFFEKVIAAEEPSGRLDVDRHLEYLPQYLLEPELCWKNLDYTRGELSDDESDKLDNLDGLGLGLHDDNRQANADATLFLQESNCLVFGEHRTSVVSGGTTARPSLLRKPRALVKELAKDDDVITIPHDVATQYGLTAGTYTFTGFLKEVGVDKIHIHIGILFDEDRRPATWGRDPQRSTSHRLIGEFKSDTLDSLVPRIENIALDRPNLKVEFEVPVDSGTTQSIPVHMSFLYGNIYLNTLYSGTIDAVGPSGSLDTFHDPTSLEEIIGSNEADDLWLGFSVAERENKIYEMSDVNSNNAIEMANMVLNNDNSTEKLIEFRQLYRNSSRDEIDQELLSLATEYAEEYNEYRENRWVEWVYGTDPTQYLRDVAIEVLVHDTLSCPLFVQRFPTSSDGETEDSDTGPTLADVRQMFEQYLFDIDQDTKSKQDIFRVVRNNTVYQNSGVNTPEDENDSVIWSQALTKSEIGDLLDIRTPSRVLSSMAEGTTHLEGGLLINQGDRYAVPAQVADRMGEFMLELPPAVERSQNQDLRDLWD